MPAMHGKFLSNKTCFESFYRSTLKHRRYMLTYPYLWRADNVSSLSKTGGAQGLGLREALPQLAVGMQLKLVSLLASVSSHLCLRRHWNGRSTSATHLISAYQVTHIYKLKNCKVAIDSSLMEFQMCSYCLHTLHMCLFCIIFASFSCLN